MRRGLVACLWLCTSVGALGIHSVAAEPVNQDSYQQARESFNRRNYRHALDLLERVPNDLSASQKADASNLRGVIYLRQGRFDQARTAFAEAAKEDPKLWAARYNEAEVTFRQGHYAASRQEFDRLRDRTSRVFHPAEHRFLDYKARLADLCAGRDGPAREFIERHRNDPEPPPAWYYLSAALERQQGRPEKAVQWMAQAEDKHPAAKTLLYAESLERLDRPSEPAAGAEHMASSRHVVRRSPGMERAIVRQGRERAATPPVTTVAMVQLMPDAAASTAEVAGRKSASTEAPAFRFDSPVAPADQSSSNKMPPVGSGLFPGEMNPAATIDAGSPLTSVLAKPRGGRATPTPKPSPTPAPDETPATQSGTNTATLGPSPVATPTPSPTEKATPAATSAPAPDGSPAAATNEYTQKYEAAYVEFLNKKYPETLALLEEADKIQSKQPQTATLRAQVFKQEYEAAYVAYRKADYPAALDLLEVADKAQPEYPDALNLRGLVYAKQRVYERAESMFKRAVGIDPTLWAAKFNYAELPFNRGDYTTARGRFEDLLAETDATKRPREAELTQYKVFLTLLLEGKTDQARAFMDHFNFSGATPAKYFCNAAMNFRAGTTDKALEWIESAKKEFRNPQLVSIFLESFYRLGWMADPNAASTGAAVAASSPAVEAAAPSVAPVPDASPDPSATVAVAGATPGATASASPVLMTSSSPSATVALGADATPGQTPVPGASSATVTPAVSSTPGAVTTVGPADTGEPRAEVVEESSTGSDILRLGIGAAVLLYGCYISYRLISTAARRKAKRRAARVARRKAVAEQDDTLR